jgi:hypothetical protein
LPACHLRARVEQLPWQVRYLRTQRAAEIHDHLPGSPASFWKLQLSLHAQRANADAAGRGKAVSGAAPAPGS